MDSKKKRSSLRSAPMEATTTPQVKRRISFNGKKLVRIFSNERCWDNSCEVSDHSTDASAAAEPVVYVDAADKVAPHAAPPQQPLTEKSAKSRRPLQSLPIATSQATVPSAVDKENIPRDSQYQSNVSALYTTLDFINKPQRLSASVQIENSVDFTLLDRERMRDTSFSLDEIDMECLRRAGKQQQHKETRPVQKPDDTCYMDERVDESIFYEEPINRPDAKAGAPITIFIDETMSETIVADGNQSKTNEGQNLKLTTTTYDQDAIQTDGSAEFENDFRGYLQAIIATPLKATEMEISMLDASQKLERIALGKKGANEKQRKTINFSGEEEIEMSMLDAQQNLDSVVERKGGQQQQQRRTIHFSGEDKMEMSMHDPRQNLASVVETKGGQQQRKTIYFSGEDEMEMSMHDPRQNLASVVETKGVQQQRKTNHFSGEDEMEMSMHDPRQNLVSVVETKGGQQRKTIQFSAEDEIEMSMHDPRQNLASVVETNGGQQRKTIQFSGEDKIEMSMHDPRQNLASVVETKGGQQRKTIQFSGEDEIEMSMHDPRQNLASVIEPKGRQQQRKTIHFSGEDEMEMSMHDPRQNLTSVVEKELGDQQQRRIGEDEMEMSRHDSQQNLISISGRKGGGQQRKTINFSDEDAQMEETRVAVATSKIDERVKQRKSILFKNNGSVCNEMDLTNPISKDICTLSPSPTMDRQAVVKQQTAPAVPDSTAKKTNASKVVVVRKICTPLNNKPLQDFEKQRFSRLQKKQQQQELINAPTLVHKHNTSNKKISIFDMSLAHNSRHDGFSSPELSSPILPPEYLPRGGNKKLNFRQLNHDIEHGKITIFPDTPKTPLSKRRALVALSATKSTERSDTKSGKQNRKKTKFESTNFTAEDKMQLSLLETTNENREIRKSYLNFNEADMLLDNTSFLTKAKLGDETVSRNSSKASCSQRRETIHFNSEIEENTPELTKTKNVTKPRKTLDCFDEMELEAQENCALQESSQKHLNHIQSSNTKEIDLSLCPKEIKQLKQQTLIELDQNSSNKLLFSKSRQTIHCFDDIDLDESNVATRTKQDRDKSKVSDFRQTLHVAEDIDLELENILPQDNSVKTKRNVNYSEQPQHLKENVDEMDFTLVTSNEIKQNIVTKKRQTLHFSDDIELDDAHKVTKPATERRQHQSSNGDKDMSLNSSPNEKMLNIITKKQGTLPSSVNIVYEPKSNKKIVYKSGETLSQFGDIDMDQSNVAIKYQDIEKNKISNPRQTLYLAEDIDLETVNILPKSNSKDVTQNAHYSRESQHLKANDDKMDCTLDSNEIKKTIVQERRQTLHFSDGIELENDSNKVTQPAPDRQQQSSNVDIVNIVGDQNSNKNQLIAKLIERLDISDIDMNQSNVAIKSHQDVEKNKLSNPRQSLDLDLEAVNILPKSNLKGDRKNFHYSRESQHLKANVDEEMECTWLVSNEIKQPIITKRRQTLHFSDDIELENDSNNVTEPAPDRRQQRSSNVDIVNIVGDQNLNKNQLIDKFIERLDISDIDLNQSNVAIKSHQDEKNKLSNPSQTLDLDLEAVNILSKSNLIGDRKDVHYSRESQHLKANVDEEMDCTLLASNEIKQPIVTKRRQTLHFSEDIELENDSNNVTEPAPDRRQQQSSNVDIVNTVGDQNSNKNQLIAKFTESLVISDDIDMNQSNVAIKSHQDVEKNKLSNPRKTLDLDLEAVNILPKSNLKGNRKNVHYSRESQHLKANVDEEMDCTLLVSNEIKQPIVTKRRQTLHFSDDIELENDFNNVTEPAAGRRHLTQFKSPIRNIEQQQFSSRWCEGTPHRSLIDFELLERKMQLEEDVVKTKQNVYNNSPKSGRTPSDARKGAIPKHSNTIRSQTTYEPADIVLDISGLTHIDAGADASSNDSTNRGIFIDKRSAMANLTPNLPQSKKRQTVIFSDCDLDTTDTQLPVKSAQKKLGTTVDGKNQRSTLFLPVEMHIDGKGVDAAAKSTNPDVIEILDDECENVCSETRSVKHHVSEASRTQPSEIPMLISSARKSNSHFEQELRTSIKPNEENDQDLNKFSVNYSLNTIEIPRKHTINAATSLRKSRSIPMFDSVHNDDAKDEEDNPITISDVSTHYLAQRKSAASNRFQSEIKSFVDLTLCNTGGSSAEGGRKRRTFGGGDNSFLHLTLPELDEIEKTRLSLVETLLDSDTADDDDEEEEDVDDEHQQQQVEQVEEDCQKENTNQSTKVVTVRQNASILCHKCKRCQDTFSNETISTTTSSFVLPALPAVDSGFEEIKRLRKRPTIEDVQEYYRRLELTEKVPVEDWLTPDGKVNFEVFGNDDDDDEKDGNAEQEDEIDLFIAKFKNDWDSIEDKLMEETTKSQQRELFEVRLDDLVSEHLPGWILNYQMRNILQFSYNNLMQLCVVIVFEDKAGLGLDIDIKNVQLQNNRIPEKNWKPYDFMLHFQAKLELSVDLRLWCAGNTEADILEMMQKIDEIFAEIVKTGRDLWKLVINEYASLVRNANRTYVRKVVRRIVTPNDSYARVENTEFSIEVMNFKKICFKDIVKPPLHLFREDIQNLPTGLEFLRVFLKDPCSYLKH